jgi:hypothetical protein
MPRHAGFAATIAIRQQTLQGLIRVLHHANQLPHTLTGGVPGISASFFLEQPLLTCSSGSSNRLILDLTGRGPLMITPPGDPPATRTVLFRARMIVPPRLSLQNGSLMFGVDGLNSVLDSFDIDPLSGGPYPPNAQVIIDSDAFRSGIETLIQTQLAALRQLAPPLNVNFLGAIANAAGTMITPAVLDGAMAMGIDVNGTNGVTTHGNAGLLTDTTEANDVGMWTNPAALPIVMADVRTRIEEAVADADATLSNLNFTLIEGAFHIRGHADKGNEGSVDFSLDAVPRLIRPGTHDEWDEEYGEHFEIDTPAREELWFESANVQVDINRPWWSYLLSVLGVLLTFGIGTMIIEAIVDMIRNNITSGITQGGGNTVAERVQEFTFAGTTEPTFRLKIETYECHVEGIFAGMTLRPQIPAPRVDGPASISIEEVIGTTLRYTVKLPFDAHPDDPMLSVRWTVRRMDTNQIIRNVDGQARSGLTLDLSGEPALLTAPEIRIACRVYSTLGPVTTDLFNATVALRVTDVLDRSHPFVRWQHQVYTPVVRVEADGSHTQLGFEQVDRASNIHRTSVPGRCRMVSRYSSKVSRTDDGSGAAHLEYLDALPFPQDELVARRAAVCDYCFFGGPDKTTPLI